MSDLPAGLTEFLDRAGWGGAKIDPLPGDASFRRYFRVSLDGRGAMLMDAPPPHEDPRPFLHVAGWLTGNGMRAPAVYSEDAGEGWGYERGDYALVDMRWDDAARRLTIGQRRGRFPGMQVRRKFKVVVVGHAGRAADLVYDGRAITLQQ